MAILQSTSGRTRTIYQRFYSLQEVRFVQQFKLLKNLFYRLIRGGLPANNEGVHWCNINLLRK